MEISQIITWKMVVLIIFFTIVIVFRIELKQLLSRIKQWKLRGKAKGFDIEICAETDHSNNSYDEISGGNTNNDGVTEIENKIPDTLGDVINSIKEEGYDQAKINLEIYIQKQSTLNAAVNKSLFLYSAYRNYHITQSLLDIRELYNTIKEEQIRHEVLFWWSTMLEKSDQHEELIILTDSKIADFSDDYYRSKLLIYKTDALVCLNRTEEAISVLIKETQSITEQSALSILYRQIANIIDNEDKNISAICYEKALSYAPHDTDLLFDAAYSQSNSSLDALALKNYHHLVALDKSAAMAHNNLAVEMKKYSLVSLAYDHYSHSSDLDLSLANANIGLLFMSVGMLDRAQDMVNNALKLNDVHKSVYILAKNISEKREREEKEIKEYISKAQELSNNVQKYISCYFECTDNADPFSGEWLTEDGVQVTIDIQKNGTFKSTWFKEISQNHTKNAGLLGPFIQRDKYTIAGKVTNGSAKVTIKNTPENTPVPLLGVGYATHDCYSYLDSSTGEWIFFETNIQKKYTAIFHRQ